jgi:hypothetical protein
VYLVGLVLENYHQKQSIFHLLKTKFEARGYPHYAVVGYLKRIPLLVQPIAMEYVIL